MDEIEELREAVKGADSSVIAEGPLKEIARIAVEGYYDFQQVRQSMMNRVRDVVRKKREGIPFDEVEEEKEKEDYDKVYSDGNLLGLLESMYGGEDEKFEEQGVHGEITEQEYDYLNKLLEVAHESKKMEKNFKVPMEYFKEEPIYRRFLQHIRGISTVMNANLIKRMGYCGEHGPHVSNLWSYAGLAPGQERSRGKKAGYNVELKTLCWKISRQMMMAGSLYKKHFYDPYKEEQLEKMNNSECRYCGKPSHEHHKPGGSDKHYCTGECEQEAALSDFELAIDADGTPPWNRGHAHNRALRYMAKKFLKHYWVIARDIKGLETTDPWIVREGGHEKREDSPENPYWMLQKLIEEE